ncbi:hypothetical protein A2662_02370 [Candidatus Giovannonibacteria bacterium RIFCSPHIGHO2_01_FULL_45_33]|nr:MAG: hypothetical protein A2662_02370 [Candidatus Giovannonibacteria bacterium RIFCSPHIGHO2_01_FULL_45_33]
MQVYFPKGALTFFKSEHTLTRDKDYYVCSKKQKGQCDNPNEKRIKAPVLERNFSRLAMKFRIPEGNEIFIFKNIYGKILHAYIDEIMESQNDSFGAGVEAMKAELKERNMQEFQRALSGTKESFIDEIKNDNLTPITALLTGTMMVLAKKEPSETDVGKLISYLSKKIYLDDNGDISKIKLHKLGSFAIQYIEKLIPGYSRNFFHLLTRSETFESLEFKTVAKNIRSEDMADLLPYDPFYSMYAMSKLQRTIFGKMTTAPAEEMLSYVQSFDSLMMPQLIVKLTKLASQTKNKNGH